MTGTLEQQLAAVAAVADFGMPTARKTGRDPRWPYVPVIYRPAGHQEQLRGLAFATRQEAVKYATEHIELERESLAQRLGERRNRALRESYGLPRELGV